MMVITCVDDDRNNNARRSLRLALSFCWHSQQMVVGEQKLDSLSLIGRTCSSAAAAAA